MRLFIVIVLCLSSLSAIADEQALVGFWEGGDTASMSIYGTIQISESNISWGGHTKYHPKCLVTYTLEHEDSGTTFKDQQGRIYVISPNSKFHTYLLKVSGGKCTTGISHLRLTFEDDSTSYLAMVEYKGLSQPVGWMHFFRR